MNGGAFGGENRERLLQQINAPKEARHKQTPEERMEIQRAYYRRTREVRLEKARRYRAEHPEKVRAAYQKWKAKQDKPLFDGSTAFSDMSYAQRRAYAAKYSAGRKRYMYFAEYQAAAVRCLNTNLSKDEQRQAAIMGMATSLGRIAAAYGKKYQGATVITGDIAMEIGEMFCAIARMCDALGYDMDTIAKWNIEQMRSLHGGG